MMPPGLAVSEISSSRWHSGQATVFISQSQKPFQLSPIKTHYNFPVHNDHRSSPATYFLYQFIHRFWILDDVAIRK